MFFVQDWPPLFGRLSDATTIRDFWGKFWHQQLRNVSPLSLQIRSLFPFAQPVSQIPALIVSILTQKDAYFVYHCPHTVAEDQARHKCFFLHTTLGCLRLVWFLPCSVPAVFPQSGQHSLLDESAWCLLFFSFPGRRNNLRRFHSMDLAADFEDYYQGKGGRTCAA